MTLTRRALFGGFAGLLVAPAIVRASSLMAVKPLPDVWVSSGVIVNHTPVSLHSITAAMARGGDMLTVWKCYSDGSQRTETAREIRPGVFDLGDNYMIELTADEMGG